MRDILFRAWDRDVGKYYYFSLEDLNYGRVKLTLSSCQVEQFTGLFDKSGKKIYEGDIVQCFGPSIRPALVEWQDGGFGYYVPYDFIWFGHNYNFEWKDGHSQKIEVIGNSFEKPALLKKLEKKK